MSQIGIQTSEGAVNASVGACAINLRNACQTATNLQQWIIAQGGTTGLVALGFSSANATALLNAVNYLNTIAEIFFGVVPQTPAFDFDNALAALYGAT